MKTILMIYDNRENWNAIEYLNKCVESIFENYVQVNNVFLNELGECEIIDGDLYLVLFEDMIYKLKKHVVDFDKVVVMTRGINKKFINELRNIPSNTDILVVNDSYASTIQTVNTFYELGISNINFIPYDKRLDLNNYYNDIKICLTPNELDLVPKFIEKVINIGFREIGYDTTIRIMQKLRLSHKSINRNIIKNMDSIVEPNAVFKSNYLNSYLKSEMLNKIIFNSYEGIMLTDSRYNLVYSNEKLNRIFNIKEDFTDKGIKNFMDKEIYDFIVNNDLKSKLVRIHEENYTIEKSPVMLMDLIIGYNFIFRNEKDIRDMEINLKNNLVKKGLFAKYTFSNIVHKSNIMKRCIELSKKAAKTDFTISITGESGTGKELLAQSIHNYSDRKAMPFVAINCASLPESLLESQLFGYEGGSFTGASKNGRIGLFEQANTGTIFLDEIGDMSYNVQTQLLRVIQERQIMRIGSDRVISIDVRVIVATNKNLEEEVHKGNFRSDLFYRLNIIPIHLPPLRERREDILLLFNYFLGGYYVNVTDEEKNAVLEYNWPGNIRELENTANYYKTFNELPKRIFKGIEIIDKKEVNYNEVEVLKIIKENTDSFHGIGRNKIIYDLMQKGTIISDAKTRSILESLSQKGLIEVRKGRSGNRITEKGLEYLNLV